MVLVDTSVWLRFLAGKAFFAQELSRLLDLNEVAGHELVYGELLMGDHSGRLNLLDAYHQMHQASCVSQQDVVAFVRARTLNGRGVGWIDVQLLASAITGRLKFWTADTRLHAIAEKLDIAYTPRSGESIG